MNQVGWDIVVVLAIVLIGGFFAGAEMALVSLREGQVRSIRQRGKRGQRAAKLAQDPNRFLSWPIPWPPPCSRGRSSPR